MSRPSTKRFCAERGGVVESSPIVYNYLWLFLSELRFEATPHFGYGEQRSYVGLLAYISKRFGMDCPLSLLLLSY